MLAVQAGLEHIVDSTEAFSWDLLRSASAPKPLCTESLRGSRLGAGCLLLVPGHCEEDSLGRCPAGHGGHAFRGSCVCTGAAWGAKVAGVRDQLLISPFLPPQPLREDRT